MKKIVIIGLIILGAFCIWNFALNKDVKRTLNITEDKEFYIDELNLLGNHLNIKGCIDEPIDGELFIVLKNGKKEISVDATFDSSENKTCFKLSDKNNEGIYLDDLKQGDYLLLVKNLDSKEYFYTLENKNNFDSMEYYTITKNNKNNKINIDFGKDKNKDYLKLKIENSKLPKDVYDITIDPGHGGNDPGSSYELNGRTYSESDLTLKISLLLKERLEKLGLKVKLTRENDINLNPYGKNGRAVIANEVKSKYSISIHLNSASGTMNYGGVEVYTPNDINYDLAKLFAKNIESIVGYSKKPTDKITNGVYFTYFTKSDIEESKNQMLESGNKPYNIKEGVPYMFMIREVGGLNTGAYIDGRNEDYELNPYYNSVQTAEPYLIELGYINYKNDLSQLVNNPEDFANAISKSFEEYLSIS